MTKEAKTIAKKLGVPWREDAERTLLELQAELRKRKEGLKNIELVGAIRMLAEALTTSRAAIPDKPEDAPAPPPVPPASVTKPVPPAVTKSPPPKPKTEAPKP